jgi:hypothetical protein
MQFCKYDTGAKFKRTPYFQSGQLTGHFYTDLLHHEFAVVTGQ